MTSRTRRTFGGRTVNTNKLHSPSSSTTSLQIDTPSESSRSPSLDMPPRTNGNGAVEGLTVEMADTAINGSGKNRRSGLNRKQSSPMMPPFMVSAPGKVIVFGEHAVVHGKVRDRVRIRVVVLILHEGSYRSGNFLTILSPRNCTFEIETNHFLTISRYQPFAYMEY